ncbi:alkaline phosphatase family protein [candidate division WOR-3 bacterium]|nr:alkaline phosphatase family protein [candidate division WOR-3 bacterium]
MKTLKNKVMLIVLIFFPVYLFGYIGPGAGFALFGSFLATFIAIIALILSLLLLPLRMLIRFRKRRRIENPPLARKVIVLGMDGLDPELLEKLIKEGKLPHFERLAKVGDFKRLETTLPPLSPVAWSTFQTGVNPEKHNIFGFLKRIPQGYKLESADTSFKDVRRTIQIGKYRIPLGKPSIRSNRMSKAFWKILGEYGIFSRILNVPVTFPPPRLNGVCLAGLGVPDLRGTQGEFLYYTDEINIIDKKITGGLIIEVAKNNNRIISHIPGPPSPFRRDGKTLKIPFRIDMSNNPPILRIQGRNIRLEKGVYSDWIELNFRAAIGITITGITKFLLKESNPFKLYLTPVNISPKSPAMAISFPSLFARYLYSLHGNFSTLGFAEDTWALIEGIISEEDFLEQSYSFYNERKKIFLQSLDDMKEGVIAIVFDIPDRIQHMFINNKEKIEQLYITMDELLGGIYEKIDEDTLLLVLSDHGFKEFKWEFNINKWLKNEGYLIVQEGLNEGGDYFKGVDWKKTKAYSFGYSGIYLNIKGREPEGLISSNEIKALILDIRKKLKDLKNPKTGEDIFKEVYLKDEVYNGPYKDSAPDIILGYSVGYRTSWESVIGRIIPSSSSEENEILKENKKKWCGDHCFDPQDIPGVLLSNFKIEKESPHLRDISPTILDAIGIRPPDFIDGESLLSRKRLSLATSQLFTFAELNYNKSEGVVLTKSSRRPSGHGS